MTRDARGLFSALMRKPDACPKCGRTWEPTVELVDLMHAVARAQCPCGMNVSITLTPDWQRSRVGGKPA